MKKKENSMTLMERRVLKRDVIAHMMIYFLGECFNRYSISFFMDCLFLSV